MEEGRDGQAKEGAEHLCDRNHKVFLLSSFFLCETYGNHCVFLIDTSFSEWVGAEIIDLSHMSTRRKLKRCSFYV